MKHLQLPQPFREKIVRAFGETGSNWLRRLPELLERCAERWRLTDCRLSPALSYNLICFARSPAFGPVALKIGVPHPELSTEMKALALYKGRHICRCHDQDEAMGALLLERVMPGLDLDSLPGSRDRIMTAARLIARLPIPLADDHGLPSYADWVGRAFARARAEHPAFARLLGLVDTAEGLFSELEATTNRPRVLLHGDLHHKNILQDAAGEWKAIDPKGAVGLPILEAARFVLNELDRADPAEQPARLALITSLLSAELGESRRTIAICGFVDSVLGTCWHFEDNSEPTVIAACLDRCELFLHQISA